jgi:Uma2 family endonuclease
MFEMILRSYPPVTVEPPYLVQKYGVTEEEFDQFANEDVKAELFDGVLIVHSPATLRHDDLCTFLSALMRVYADNRKLGKVFGSNNAVMRLSGSRQFAPHPMFVRAGRESLLVEKKLEGVPDLVVEVLSESTRRYDLEDKRRAYRQAGIGEIWFVDDDQKQLIFDARQQHGYREQLKRRGKISSRALPGFWLEVSWLWQDELPDTLNCLQTILAS